MKRKEKAPVEKMTRDQILETVQPLPSETKLKAWTIQIDEKFYHICAYGGVYRVLPKVSIWDSNKKGKRVSKDPIFSINGNDRDKCIGMFLDGIEAEVSRIKAEAEETKFNEDLKIEIAKTEEAKQKLEDEAKAAYEAKVNAELDEEMKILADLEAEDRANSKL